MKKLLVSLFLLLCFGSYAQNKLNWSASVGGSFPIGAFANMTYDPNTLVSDCGIFDENVNCGAASTGFNFGVEAMLPMKTEKLSFTFSVDILYNGMNSVAKKYLNIMAAYVDNSFRQEMQSSGVTTVSSSCVVSGKPAYLNIPLMIGFKYDIPLNSEMKLFAEGGVGANIRFITPIKLTERASYTSGGYYDEITVVETFNYATKGSFAFRVGAGLKFAENLSLSAYYYYIGEGDVSTILTARVQGDNSLQPAQQSMQFGYVNPMMIVAKLGYDF